MLRIDVEPMVLSLRRIASDARRFNSSKRVLNEESTACADLGTRLRPNTCTAVRKGQRRRHSLWQPPVPQDNRPRLRDDYRRVQWQRQHTTRQRQGFLPERSIGSG